MKTKIVLSVCIVSYNHEKYIEKAINSVLIQNTNFNYEIIIGDDCSTDNTIDVILNRFNSAVVLYERKENVGLTKNLYDLMKKAQGDYICILSGDDWLEGNNALQKYVDYFKTHEDCSCVSSYIPVYDKKNRIINIFKPKKMKYTLTDFLMWENFNCYLITIRNFWKNNNEECSYLYKTSRNNEELPLWLYVLEKGNLGIIPENLYAYRYMNEEGLDNYNSTHDELLTFKDYYEVIKKLDKIKHGEYDFSIMLLNICGIYGMNFICNMIKLKSNSFLIMKEFLTYMDDKDRKIFYKYLPLLVLGRGRIPKIFINKELLLCKS